MEEERTRMEEDIKEQVRRHVEGALSKWKMGVSEREEIRRLCEEGSKKREELIREATREWVENVIRRDLEELWIGERVG